MCVYASVYIYIHAGYLADPEIIALKLEAPPYKTYGWGLGLFATTSSNRKAHKDHNGE